MCLYPTRIRNPRYLPTKRNNFNPPQPLDERLRWIDVPCGHCYECLKQKANSWRFRLQEEIKDQNCLFVTLTFNDEALQELAGNQCAKENQNATEYNNGLAKAAVKRFRERYRKKYHYSPKHWFVTELGGEYGRIHLHGILFTTISKEELDKLWKYGFTYVGEYVNTKTINYIVKYMFKQSEINRLYTPIVLTSPGIGKNFRNRYDYNALSVNKTKVRLSNGTEIEAPTYYKQSRLTEDEKVALHLKNITKDETWIDGIRYVNNEKNEITINKARKQAQEYYESLGYLSENEILAIRREKKRKKK